MTDYRITVADIESARKEYEAMSPRGVFYRAATELVDLALKKRISLTVTEALAVLLQTWNKNFYRFGREFNEQHFGEIDDLLRRYKKRLAADRLQKIERLDLQDEVNFVGMFEDFESTLGPVGAAKVLHLLAPSLFPPWDVKIAKRYCLSLGKAGSNGERYWRFMRIAKGQCVALRQQGCQGNLLKSMDEYNRVQSKPKKARA